MLEQLKVEVCRANLDLVGHGLVTLTWGNVSGISDDRPTLRRKPRLPDRLDLLVQRHALLELQTPRV